LLASLLIIKRITGDLFLGNVFVVVAYAFKTHNWRGKQRHHHAECSLDKPPYSLVSGQDSTICDNRLGLTAGTLVGVYEFPFLLTGTAVTLSGAEVVQERPLLSWQRYCTAL